MEKQVVIEMSTGHVPEADGRLMDDIQSRFDASFKRDNPFIESADEYGIMVKINLNEETDGFARTMDCLAAMGFSSIFTGIVYLARSQGAKYLRLDRDADTIEGLPQFEW